MASLVAQLVKNLPAMQETWVRYLGGEYPWRRKCQPTPVFLPKIPMDRGAWRAAVHGISRVRYLATKPPLDLATFQVILNLGLCGLIEKRLVVNIELGWLRFSVLLLPSLGSCDPGSLWYRPADICPGLQIQSAVWITFTFFLFGYTAHFSSRKGRKGGWSRKWRRNVLELHFVFRSCP